MYDNIMKNMIPAYLEEPAYEIIFSPKTVIKCEESTDLISIVKEPFWNIENGILPSRQIMYTIRAVFDEYSDSYYSLEDDLEVGEHYSNSINLIKLNDKTCKLVKGKIGEELQVDNYLNLYHEKSNTYIMFNEFAFPDTAFCLNDSRLDNIYCEKNISNILGENCLLEDVQPFVKKIYDKYYSSMKIFSSTRNNKYYKGKKSSFVPKFCEKSPVPAGICKPPWNFSPEDEISRAGFTKYMFEYIKEHNLQDPNNKRLMVTTSNEHGQAIRELFQMKDGEELEFKNFQSYANRLFN